MALLLAVLLSVSSLPGHAALDSCAADCGAAQAEMVDHADADCGTCAALTGAPLVAAAQPSTLAGRTDPAVVEFIAPPPREPPRP